MHFRDPSDLLLLALLGLLSISATACAKSSSGSERDVGLRDAAAADTGRASDSAPRADTTVTGPRCDGVVCDVFEACVDGMCAPYAPCVSDAECDAGELCRNRFCLPRGTDVDGDGATADTDCDESNPLRFPGATETCDTVDEDCDDAVDEAVTRACMTACGAGVETCSGGAFVGCDAPPVGTESCNGADDDCDGTTDEALSRACSTACGAGTESCSAGAWVMCDAPPVQTEACNLADDDCDGSCDEGVAGCRRAVHRSLGGGEHFYTTSRTEAACCGYTVEHYDFFYLYASPAPGLVPFYRCLLGNGYHFYTQSAVCEGAPGSRMESILGYIARSAGVCGSVPLYRLVNGPDHFYTPNVAERDAAINVYGYRLESNAGYVWRGP